MFFLIPRLNTSFFQRNDKYENQSSLNIVNNLRSDSQKTQLKPSPRWKQETKRAHKTNKQELLYSTLLPEYQNTLPKVYIFCLFYTTKTKTTITEMEFEISKMLFSCLCSSVSFFYFFVFLLFDWRWHMYIILYVVYKPPYSFRYLMSWCCVILCVLHMEDSYLTLSLLLFLLYFNLLWLLIVVNYWWIDYLLHRHTQTHTQYTWRKTSTLVYWSPSLQISI